VLQAFDGLTGDVSGGNTDQFLAVTQQLFPLESYDADIRAPYTYTDTVSIESDNATGTWSRVLSEINALRLAERRMNGGTTGGGATHHVVERQALTPPIPIPEA
jgi:hypothetical protein